MLKASIKIRWNILFAGLWFFCHSSLAASDSIITVGIYQNPPKLYFDENKKPAGIFVDLLNEIAELENWQLNYVAYSWNDCLEQLENEKIDLLPDMAFTTERNRRYTFNAVPVIESWAQVYVRPGIFVKQLSDLSEMNVALVEGSVQQTYFDQLMNGFGYPYRQVLAGSFPDAFSEVKIGVADAAVVNHFFGVTQYEKYNLRETPVIFNLSILHFTVKKNENLWIVEAIDKHLEEWQQTSGSFYYKTLENYLLPVEDTENSDSKLIYYLVGSAVLAAGILLLFLSRRQLKKRTRELLKTNKKLNFEEKKFRNYIEYAPYGIFVADEQGRYVDINQVACEMSGFSRTELVGKAILDFIPEEGREKAKNHFDSVVKEGKSTVVVPTIVKNGEKRFWSVVAVKISPKRLIGFAEDVSEEFQLKNQLYLMGEVIDQSVNEIYLVDASDFRIRQVNKAAVKNTGYTTQELTQMTPLDLNPGLTAEQFDALIQPLLQNEKKIVFYELKQYRKDGSFYDAELHLQLIENEDEKLFSAVILDISDRKRREKELQHISGRLKKEVEEKTRELNQRIEELESFREATIERELRMEDLRREIKRLKNEH